MVETMDPTRQALTYLAHYYDGLLTDGELVGHLAELPRETLELLPDRAESYPPRQGLKERVLELKAAMERGETFAIRSHC